METVLNFISDKPWFGVIATPTPEKGSWKAKIYGVVEFLALNIGKAKDKKEAVTEDKK